jgi:hypothetical protein
MTQFPAVDPIPLPAPIWLFKLLHDLTFALHLASVELLLGGLILAIVFGLMNRRQAAGTIAHRLPTLMAFVINLGIPPLLFAQVLYGRALYTSSVLIGIYWISVIGLLMGSYYGLYAAAKRADERRPWAVQAFAALLLILTIAFIYTNNMTLMIRPAVWASMYQANPTGLQLNTGDPALLPRWLFFIAGAFPVSGAVLTLLAIRPDTGENIRRFFTRAGGFAMAAGVVVEAAFAWLAIGAQPQGVIWGVMRDPLYGSFAYAWIVVAALVFAIGVIASLRGAASRIVAIAAALSAFLHVGATVMVRDGIRDFTLRAAGFEVWNRQVVTNWSVVGLFLILFVAALGVIGYLISVVAKARRIEEKYV